MSAIVRSILTLMILACAAFYMPIAWGHALSWVLVTGKASWFGIRIEGYTVSPIRLDGLQTEELKNLADKGNWFDNLLDQVNAPTEPSAK